MYAGFATLTPVYRSICIRGHDTSLKRATWPLLLTQHIRYQLSELVNKNGHVALSNDVAYPHIQMEGRLNVNVANPIKFSQKSPRAALVPWLQHHCFSLDLLYSILISTPSPHIQWFHILCPLPLSSHDQVKHTVGDSHPQKTDLIG